MLVLLVYAPFRARPEAKLWKIRRGNPCVRDQNSVGPYIPYASAKKK